MWFPYLLLRAWKPMCAFTPKDGVPGASLWLAKGGYAALLPFSLFLAQAVSFPGPFLEIGGGQGGNFLFWARGLGSPGPFKRTERGAACPHPDRKDDG